MDDLSFLLSNLTLEEMKNNEDIDDLILYFNKINLTLAKTKVQQIKESLINQFGPQKADIYYKMILQNEKEKKFNEMVSKVEAGLSGNIYIPSEEKKVIRKKWKFGRY
jgi:uncharacterized protein YciU (UPF0263 family)